MFARPFHHRVLSGVAGLALLAGAGIGTWTLLAAFSPEHARQLQAQLASITGQWTPEQCRSAPVPCLESHHAKLQAIKTQAEPEIRKLTDARSDLQQKILGVDARAAKLRRLDAAMDQAMTGAPAGVSRVVLLGQPIAVAEIELRRRMVRGEIDANAASNNALADTLGRIDQSLARVLPDYRRIETRIATLPAEIAFARVELLLADGLDRSRMLEPVLNELFTTERAAERVDSWTDEVDGLLERQAATEGS